MQTRIASLFAAGFLATLLSGCQSWNWLISSKWAMGDPDYATKYSEPYGNDKTLRMLKQSVDARHIHGKGGSYWSGSGGGGSREQYPATGTWSLGSLFFGADGMREQRIGLGMLHGTGARDNFFGLDLGMRFSTPTRLAPFVGVGGFMGFAFHNESANMDGIDNDDDGKIDEPNEDNEEFNGILAGYPEAGLHYWLTSKTRLTGFGRYYFSEGDTVRLTGDREFWTVGIQLLHNFGDKPDKDEASTTNDSSAEVNETLMGNRQDTGREIAGAVVEILEGEENSPPVQPTTENLQNAKD